MRLFIVALLGSLVAFTADHPFTEDPAKPARKKAVSTGPVRIRGRQIEVDFDGDKQYEPFFIKGVGYSPAAVGYNPLWGYEDPDPRDDNMLNDVQILDRDFPLIAAMHANSLRIWLGDDFKDPMNKFPVQLTGNTFDKADAYGLWIIAGFRMEVRGYFSGGVYHIVKDYTDPAVRSNVLARFRTFVRAWRHEPALLLWAIGNENDLSFSATHDPDYLNQVKAYFTLVHEMAGEAYAVEGSAYHPVAVVNGSLDYIGETGFDTADAQMPLLDLWGMNVYPGASFGQSPSFFDLYEAKTEKPLWLAETSFGDHWHTTNPLDPSQGYEEDPNVMAAGNVALWDEIEAARPVTVGATYMAYSDEWWKPDPEADCGGGYASCNEEHNYDGFPATGQAPDDFFNEEWWGMVSIESNSVLHQPDVVTPRLTYHALAQRWQ